MARAEWHFGDGPAYCRGCADLGRPCARGGAGDDGHRCPEIETRLQTAAGWQAWDVALRCAGQLRTGAAGGVLGLDFGACFAMADALGYDLAGVAELLPSVEAGIVGALNDRPHQEGDG